MSELKVQASSCDIEPMVQSEEIRAAFARRLKDALAHKGIAEWGAGARLAKITGKTAKASSKWINAEAMPGRDSMLAIAKWLAVRIEWLAHDEGEMLYMAAQEPAQGSPSEKDYALIPQYTARVAAGNGYHNDHVEVSEGLVFKRDWLRRLGLKEEHLCVIYADGNSMEPTISEGDVLLIDRASTQPVSGKVYAIQRPDGSHSIKRLVQSFSGDWSIVSDNQDKLTYPTESISPEALEQIHIIGRSVWSGGGM